MLVDYVLHIYANLSVIGFKSGAKWFTLFSGDFREWQYVRKLGLSSLSLKMWNLIEQGRNDVSKLEKAIIRGNNFKRSILSMNSSSILQ